MSDSFSVLLTAERLMMAIGLITGCMGVASDPCKIWAAGKKLVGIHMIVYPCALSTRVVLITVRRTDLSG